MKRKDPEDREAEVQKVEVVAATDVGEAAAVVWASKHATSLPPLKTCLLAENNMLVRKVLTNVLKLNCYDVMLAEDGQTVVDKLKENFYDCVIVADEIPGVDGLSAIMSLREWEEACGRKKQRNVVYNAAANAPMDADMADSIGVDYFFNKTFDMRAFKKLISDGLEGI